MKTVCRNLVLALLALSMLTGCGGRRKRAAKTQAISDAKVKMALMEQQNDNQQKQIEALEKQIAELQKK